MFQTNAAAPAPTIIFLHVPKSAGSTLSKIVDQQFAGHAAYRTDPGRLRASIAEFKALSEDERRSFRLVTGHLEFGLHRWLPQPSTYMTMLRDPVDRMVSLYYFILRIPQHHLHQQVVGAKMTLQDFARSPISTVADNFMVRLLAEQAGFSNAEPLPIGGVTRQILLNARRNMTDHFSVIGLTEAFDKSLALLRRTYGWRIQEYKTFNVTPNRPRLRDLSAADPAVIERSNQMDMELYEIARKRFRELCDARGLNSWSRRLKGLLPARLRRSA